MVHYPNMVKDAIRTCLPEPVLGRYHFVLAKLAAAWYGHPSEKLIVVGVTGTNGKSSTVQFLGRILEHAGHKVAWTTTAGFKIADKEWVNDKKMTMLGRFQTQRFIRDALRAGCTHVIVETSSQGIKQSRHVGIHYDAVVFTNLTPEHIESHGSFEKYKQAKGKLFAHVAAGKRKTLAGKPIKKVSIVNADDEYANYFLGFRIDKKMTFSFLTATPSHSPLGRGRIEEISPLSKGGQNGGSALIATNLTLTAEGGAFALAGKTFHFSPIGLFNAYNILAAVATAHALDVDWATIQDAVARLESVPGRLEVIDEGQSFTVIVDYAYEPAALTAVYDALDLVAHKRIIHVVGSAGGGRDRARRAVLGKLSAERDDVVIVANEDPYDEDPWTIINEVADAAAAVGKQDGTDLFRILDRQEAIHKAVALAQEGDLVLITGKGSEPVMAVGDGKKIPWDDRAAVRRALQHL